MVPRMESALVCAVKAQQYAIVKLMMAHGGAPQTLSIYHADYGDISMFQYVDQVLQDEKMLNILIETHVGDAQVVRSFICNNKGCRNRGSKMCPNCHVARYCSKECQRKCWKRHKKHCKAMKAAAEAEATVVVEQQQQKEQ